MTQNQAAVVKVALWLMGLCLAGYILGPPLDWYPKEGLAASSVSHSSTCPPCDCDCSSQPLLSIPEEWSNVSLSDCVRHDAEESEDAIELLMEELKEREAISLEIQQRANKALLEARQSTSQYQKEAEKCNSGMETCEGARKKAEAALAAQKKLTAMWEMKARRRGWKEGMAKAPVQSQGNAQAM